MGLQPARQGAAAQPVGKSEQFCAGDAGAPTQDWNALFKHLILVGENLRRPGKHLDDRRLEFPFQKRDEPAPNSISIETVLIVGVVRPKRNMIRSQIVQQLIPPHPQQRPDQRNFRTGNRKGAFNFHPSEPPAAGASKQTHQQCFSLVVPVMGDENFLDPVFTGNLLEKIVSLPSSGLLDRFTAATRAGRRDANTLELQTPARTQPVNKPLIPIAADSAQSMVHMGHDRPLAGRAKQMQKRHGIRAA